MPKRIAILGLGLIGGSLARALHESNPALHIAAFDADSAALEWALAQAFIHSCHPSPADAVRDADIIMLAVPPDALSAIAREIGSFLRAGAILTDVASVKRQAIAAILPYLPPHAHFVPAHPIAGSEKTGVKAGRANLFKGKCVILTPEEKDLTGTPVAQICALWESIGARIEYMPAALHDRLYAYVSHLPQLVAFAARTGRLAHSSPELWTDICLANSDYIDEALGEFLVFGTQMAGELSQADTSAEDSAVAETLFPRLLAACLIATAAALEENTGIPVRRYAGAGFTEMTAPAEGDAQAVLLAISQHPRLTSALLTKTLSRLRAIRYALQDQHREKLGQLLSGVD